MKPIFLANNDTNMVSIVTIWTSQHNVIGTGSSQYHNRKNSASNIRSFGIQKNVSSRDHTLLLGLFLVARVTKQAIEPKSKR